MVCLPAEEKRAQPPYEVIPGDTAPNEREDQLSESGGLSRILNFELRCSQVSEEMICMRLMKTLSCVTRDVQARVFRDLFGVEGDNNSGLGRETSMVVETHGR